VLAVYPLVLISVPARKLSVVSCQRTGDRRQETAVMDQETGQMVSGGWGRPATVVRAGGRRGTVSVVHGEEAFSRKPSAIGRSQRRSARSRAGEHRGTGSVVHGEEAFSHKPPAIGRSQRRSARSRAGEHRGTVSTVHGGVADCLGISPLQSGHDDVEKGSSREFCEVGTRRRAAATAQAVRERMNRQGFSQRPARGR
jgi:hypothetical protein